MNGVTLADLLTVGGIGVVVALLVQLAKGSIPSPLIPWAAVGAGVVLGVGASLALGQTSSVQLGQAALTGLLGGASAVSLYALQRPAGVLPPKSAPAASGNTSEGAR